MPPYQFSPDLLQATFAAIPRPRPPPDATPAWRHAHIARLGAFPDPGPDQYIASMNPLISANPRDAPHTRSLRRRQEIFAADERG